MNYLCPVCKFDGLFEPAYDVNFIGSDEICPCCGFQFGLDDYPDREKAQKEWMEKWIAKGCNWWSKNRNPPIYWDAKKQLEKYCD